MKIITLLFITLLLLSGRFLLIGLFLLCLLNRVK